MKKIKNGVKIVIFIAVVAVLFAGVSYIVKPIWPEWNNHNVTHGIYKEPENTIETLFLGASVTGVGIIPMQLYEDYGICSYNAGTESQPLMASYYFAEEVYRLHAETLDTIVLDVDMLKKDSADYTYIKILDALRPTNIKLRFMRDFTDNFYEFLSRSISMIAYHDRWKELSEEDFSKVGYQLETFTRGYYFVTDNILDKSDSFSDIATPSYVVEDTEKTTLNNESLNYFSELTEFCEDRDIKLVLIKTPQDDWADADHNAVQALAEQYQLDFMDFNYTPYIDEIGYDAAVDHKDTKHLNYYGAVKLTDWLGQYLVEECGNRDIRQEEKYAFMEEELVDFHRKIEVVTLNEITDPTEYLSYMMAQQDYAIFLSVKEDAAASLTEEQRKLCDEIGLAGLSQLSDNDSYLAVIDSGEVVEYTQEDELLSYEGKLSDGTPFSITSGGADMGNESTIQINGTEYSPQKRGLNIVVYDEKLEAVIDQASFDTDASAERSKPVDEATLKETIQTDGTAALSGKLRELYLYDCLYKDTKTVKVLKQDVGRDNLAAYLQSFWNNEEFDIYLSANGNISDALTEQERESLADLGLSKLAALEENDSYLAVIQRGELSTEISGKDEEEIQADGEFYKVSSGEKGGTDSCSILLNGTEYASETEGLHIVVYDNVLGQCIDATVYDNNRAFISSE